MSSKRGGSFRRIGAFVVVGLGACNAIVGIEDPVVVEPRAGESCILNSDCEDERQVCLFETCSPPCQRDVDCESGEYCLSTPDGNGCVSTGRASCADGEPCPSGSACFDGECRTDCRLDSSLCLADQVCDTDGACRGPGGGGGTGGASGTGGTSGTGGMGGTSGTAGTAGNAGAGGEAGDGTVTPGDPCTDAGALKCAGRAETERFVCENDAWTPTDACGEGELCDAASDPPGECATIVPSCVGQQPGAAVCDGADRIACGPDLVTSVVDNCISIEHCRQATGPSCAACLEGEYRCSGDTLELCNDDNTGFDEVMECTDEPCNATLGRCTTEICEPNQFSCESATNTLRRCNADGTDFASEVSCGTGICDAANGECDDCVPNNVEGCIDAQRKSVCNADGQGTRSIVCADEEPTLPVCIGAGLCRACTPSTAECVDEFRVRTCTTDGQWGAPTTCTGQACAGDQCTGVCVPDSRECVDELNIRTCSSMGSWGQAVECTGQACVDDGCVGECEPGTTQCENKFNRQTCTEQGTWGPGVACTNQACVGGACTGVCRPDTLDCIDEFQIRSCSDTGTWSAGSACTGQACSMDQCSGVCVPATRQCLSPTQYQQCGTNGQWGMGTACPNQACVSGACSGSCSPGTERCAPSPGNAAEICNNTGAWVNQTTCTPTPDVLCRMMGPDASCVANPSYIVGKNMTWSGSTSVAANHLLGNPVAITEKFRVVKFGIHVRAAVTGCKLRMALYADAAGVPGARVGYSEQTPAADLAAMRYDLNPVSQITALAGTYWIMAHYQCATTAYANDTASGEPNLRSATGVTYASGPPDPYPASATTITSFAVSHFLEVQAVP